MNDDSALFKCPERVHKDACEIKAAIGIQPLLVHYALMNYFHVKMYSVKIEITSTGGLCQWAISSIQTSTALSK